MFKGLPRVCVTVAGNSLAELRKRALSEIAGQPAGERFLELRLDFMGPAVLREPAGLAKLIRDLRHRRVALIVT